MSRVELRLLGGFEARLDGSDLGGFESQKSRALLAYLAVNRERQVERRFLAGLLWSERSEVSARRNLRQALHNIRGAFGRVTDLPAVFTGARGTVQLNPDLDCWLDVDIFRQFVALGLRDSGVDNDALSSAARFYGGDLLHGFQPEGCPVFDEWLMGERERLRLAAVATYQRLVDDCLRTGDYRLGIDYSHRLLTIDPTSEETHRQLMRLYSSSGRHSRALAQYQQLRKLLVRDLGVEPMPESTKLYDELVAAREAGTDDSGSDTPIGPVLPLEGRGAELRRLRAHWQDARDGLGSMTLLLGPDGIGKTRLARTFLSSVASQGNVNVRSISLAPTRDDDDAPQAVERLLDAPVSEGPATALFIDDLHWASEEDLQALLLLVQRIRRQPVWVLACAQAGTDLSIFDRADEMVQRLDLEPLQARAIHTICSGLLNLAEAQRLARFVSTWSGGNPLAVAEMVNYLWDSGILASRPTGGWALEGRLPARPGDFEALIRRRLRHLPTSSRRLLVLAALIGPRFDREVLAEAGDEHPAVVDACLEVLLDRWLIRWAGSTWTANRPESDVEVWNRGRRDGTFEFSHERVRSAVLATLDPLRAEELRSQIRQLAKRERPGDVAGGTSSTGL